MYAIVPGQFKKFHRWAKQHLKISDRKERAGLPARGAEPRSESTPGDRREFPLTAGRAIDQTPVSALGQSGHISGCTRPSRRPSRSATTRNGPTPSSRRSPTSGLPRARSDAQRVAGILPARSEGVPPSPSRRRRERLRIALVTRGEDARDTESLFVLFYALTGTLRTRPHCLARAAAPRPFCGARCSTMPGLRAAAEPWWSFRRPRFW